MARRLLITNEPSEPTYDHEDGMRVWFRVVGFPGVTVMAEAPPIGDRLQLRRLEVVSTRQELDSALLRTVANSLSDIRAAVRTEALKNAAVFGDRDLRKAAKQPRIERPGDPMYAEWADRYEQACAADPRRPIAYLAAKYKIQDVKRVRNLVQKARERGFLTRQGPGQAGGEATPAARQILDENRGGKK